MDFGLAKVKGGSLLTREGTTLGTVAYMSPEQARGQDVDHRSDIWSLGVVIYEMLCGQLPFTGDHEASILYSVVHEEPKPLKAVRSDIPTELQHIINHALKKKPGSRYSSAGEILNDLKKYRESLRAEEEGAFNLQSLIRIIRKPRIFVFTIAVIAVVCIAAVWFFNRQTKISWAREKAIPEINRLLGDRNYAKAFHLVEKAEKYIPKEPSLIELLPRIEGHFSFQTTPTGADVYIYDEIDSDWEYMGRSPIDKARTSPGYKRWKIEKEGFETVEGATLSRSSSVVEINLKLDERGSLPPGMIKVPGGEFGLRLAGLDHLETQKINEYLIDKYEVTNKEFKKFIDNGGYENKEYWRHTFIKDGRILSWEEAMVEFKDKTGRLGPATWEMSDYPEGQDNYPVTGISWYEAAAYAEFAEKSLPTVYHWDRAADPRQCNYIVPISNFNGSGPSLVGIHQSITSYGTYDMAGNVREWCWNEREDNRYILGGGWNDQVYMFNWAYSQPPFDRSPTNGFRCVKYLGKDENLETLKGSIRLPYRDLMKEKPVSDEIFNIYMGMYRYDKTELNSTIESVDDQAEDFIKEKIFFDAAYGGERVIAYLFLPKIGNPPYQAIAYFPGSSAINRRSSETIESLQFRNYDFIIKSGRAVIYPIYKSTYERGDDINSSMPDETNFYKEHVIQWAKDLGRSIDYLETRKDIDTDKLAYYGLSWGGRLGGLMLAVEKRFKVGILNVAGLRFQRKLPEVDPFNFVSRIKMPVLMLNGRYDHFFPYETSQIPMFKLLGTPPEHKRHVVYETGHFVPKTQLIMEALDWLDRYLGPVK
jgi:formylglycine-generating enzyme required for sulfatase activity/dienelactone hydrolase